MRARDEARDGALFAVAGLAAGGGHYLFQVLASRALSADVFAEFTGWMAHLTVAFVAGGVTQYLANFHPVSLARRGRWLVFVNAGALAAALVGAMGETLGPASLAAVTALAAAQGWAFGQAQIRLDFRGLALAQMLSAGAKLALPLAFASGDGRGFALGVALGFLPPIWFLSIRLSRASEAPPPTAAARAWVAPVVLAVAANVLPQFDLLVTRHALDAADFAAFARASLFYKAIYFAVFVFAQWLLPRQIRGGAGPGPALLAVAGFATIATVAATTLAPTLAPLAFGWPDSPPRSLILASCAHVSLLTLLFLITQDRCARARPALPIALMAVLSVEAALVIATRPGLDVYLTVVVVAQTLLLATGLRLTSRPCA